MHHAITIGGLLQSIGMIVGLIAAAFGLLMLFAGGMSDSPSDGDETSKNGCIMALVGVTLVIGCVVWMAG